MIRTLAIATALLATSCAAPTSAWVAAGAPRAAEMGVLSEREAVIPGGPRWEAGLGFENIAGKDEESRVCPAECVPGTRKHDCNTPGTCSEDDIVGRLGLRWGLQGIGLPAVHVGGGLETDLRPYLRLGVERQLTPIFALGFDVLDRDGRFEGLVGLRASR